MNDDLAVAPESTYVISGSIPAQTITRSLQALLPTRHRALNRQRFTLLDTPDGRIYRVGAHLTHSDVNGQSMLSWKVSGEGGELAVRLPGPASFAWDLPDCSVYRLVAPVIGPRRLVPQAEVEESGSLLDVLDDRGKTVARVSVASGQARLPMSHGSWRSLPTIVTLRGLRGYTAAFDRLVPVIESRPGIRACPGGIQGLIRQHIGVPEPRDLSSLGLDLQPGVRADVGACQIHLALLGVMQRNESGLRANVDSEFLHDFRVAVRRTRSLLAQIRQVFSEEAVRHFSTEFSWVGKLTGGPRDLDVLVLTLRERRRTLPSDGLDECIALLETMQREQHARLVDGLNSDRFKKLTADWKTFLTHSVSRRPSADNARRRLTDVMLDRAWQLSRKVRRGVAGLNETTPAEAVHELRVQAKKLRYLVDVAPGSSNETDVKHVLTALKALQRVLGDFNDAHVQAARLIEYRGAMAAIGAGDDTLSVIGTLAKQASERAGDLRGDVLDEARRFGRDAVRLACRRAFKRPHPEAHRR